jgi:hypothetical protein
MLIATAASLWLIASLPSGFSVVQLAMFVGPGIVLALAVDWASHAGARREWDWEHGRRAAAFGAAIFPPFVALFFSWSGSFGPELMIALLVFSAWLALFCGLLFAALTRSTNRL